MATVRTALVTATLCVVLMLATTCARMPPTLTEEPPMNVDLFHREGDIVLPCAAVGDPEPEITWLKDGEPFTYSSFGEFRDGDLVLTMSRSEDEGYYQCVATNGYGKALSRVAYAQLISFRNFDYDLPHLQESARAGESLTIPCHPHLPQLQLPPASKLFWGVYNEDIGYYPPKIVTLNKRVQIGEEGSLLFSNVVSGDARLNMTYVCMMYNPKLGGSAFHLSQHEIIINPGSSQLRVPNIMYKTSGHVVGFVGKSVTLQCFFSGYPTPTVSWQKQASNIPTDGRATQRNHNTTLVISGIRLEDEGTYICSASSAAGRNAGEEEIFLEVDSIPSFITNQMPVNVNMTNGDAAIFRCVASAIPAATNQWCINGEPITRDTMPTRMILYDNDRILKILNLCNDCDGGDRTTDLMVIQCNSSNIHGSAYAQGYLNVLNRTEIYVAPPEEKVLDIDEESLKLPCSASSDSSTPVTVTWFKGSDQISLLGDYRLLVGPAPDNLLTIDMIDLSPEEKRRYQDTYKCEADNGYSTAARTTQLTVKLSDDHQSSGVLGVVIGSLVVVAVAIITVLSVLIIRFIQRRSTTHSKEPSESDNGNDYEIPVIYDEIEEQMAYTEVNTPGNYLHNEQAAQQEDTGDSGESTPVYLLVE